jgi:hypothetical protein
MNAWRELDAVLALELKTYLENTRVWHDLYGATRWTMDSEGAPWTEYYAHTSEILGKMRDASRVAS